MIPQTWTTSTKTVSGCYSKTTLFDIASTAARLPVNFCLDFVHDFEGRDLALAVHLKSLLDRVQSFQQLDRVRLELPRAQKVWQLHEQLGSKFMIINRSL